MREFQKFLRVILGSCVTYNGSWKIYELFIFTFHSLKCIFRMTVEEGLAHPYLHKYSMPDDEPVADHPFVIEHGNDNNLTLPRWKGEFLYIS